MYCTDAYGWSQQASVAAAASAAPHSFQTTTRACVSCRKVKGKCEAGDGQNGWTGCRRCQRLKLQCQLPVRAVRDEIQTGSFRKRAREDDPAEPPPKIAVGALPRGLPPTAAFVVPWQPPCFPPLMSQMRTPSKFPEHLPVEVLRDWALQAIAKNNAMLMGVTLKHAASSGYCLLDILGAAPALLAITDEASRKKNKSSSDSSVMLHEESGYGVPSSLPGRFMKVTKSIEETHGTKVPVHVPPAFASVAVAVAAATSQDMAAYCLRDGWALSAMMSMEPPASTAPPPIGFNRQESVYVTAIYDCVGEKEDELSFKVGDLIEVKRIGAVGGWCVGCLVDKPERPGLFPYSFAVSM